MAPKATLAVVLMLCCASAAMATYNKCYGDHDCKADNQCVYGVCQYGKCTYKHKNKGTACNDGNHCTVGDYCYKGDCKAGHPKKCNNPNNQCKRATCNPKSGQCVVRNKPYGSSCNDGNACTFHDKCKYGACKGHKKVCNNKKGQCWKTYCDSYSGQCQYKKLRDGTKCNDGNHKTEHDQCKNGYCKGTPIYYG